MPQLGGAFWSSRARPAHVIRLRRQARIEGIAFVPLPRRRAKTSPRAKVEARGRRDPLKTYREKRDFRRTAEPEPWRQRGTDWQFVVQQHAARRLPYDLRLELDGGLRIWPVTP